ncbi:hypothetical protein GALMADRAFT_226933 [Galerina marginata CBS 339.88]|uniref:C2H2-type domain-containing protein n=1 Tax=Galerina marginata (strain CBS 339.88) TaxID=685588 RepID=A0A067SWE3_GALM3|nr:hypothetical protein GALMADRAFT_226933 [Galerina marginata CBS 339.88]
MKNAYQTTVLGKRKATRQNDSLVLHLSPAPSASPAPEPSDSDSTYPVASTSKSGPPIIINGLLVANTKKCFRCTFQGCEKAYTKPSRLGEHERSHTGQRPFACDKCEKSYLRETHLHAHARSHLPESARPFPCERVGCEKRFWTSQHLQVHHSSHDGAKPYKCSETGCHEAFSKHHLLRAHICSEHAPPGTKPYQCGYEGCARSFNTNQHLRTHQKTHDDKRYTCVHANCLASEDSLPKYFPTWSALQSHIRTAHPPTCWHPSCAGRIFSNQGNLRAHLKIHEQREAELELEGDINSGDETDRPAKKKRRGGEHGRDWKCEVAGCDRDFKSKKAMNIHMNVTHLGKRDYVCHHTDCNNAFGYKHLLQRHLAKCHSSDLPWPEQNEEDSSEGESQEPTFDIDGITGYAYAKRSEARLNDAKALRCPFPDVQDFTGERSTDNITKSIVIPQTCDYVFSRAYDLRRHLHACHDIAVLKETLDIWAKRQKKLVQL